MVFTKSIRLLVLLSMLCFQGFAQRASIGGQITDDSGQAIPFVNIYVKASGNGVAATANGQYTLYLAQGESVVRFSALGYETQEKTVTLKKGEAKRVNIQLTTASTSLGEFEVVANKRDRAKEIMKLVRSNRSSYLNQLDRYQCRAYTKSSLERLRTGKVDPQDSIPMERLRVIMIDSFAIDTVHKKVITDIFEVSSTLSVQMPGLVKETIHAVKEHGKVDRNPNPGRSINVESDFEIESGEIVEPKQQADNVYLLYPDHTGGQINLYQNLLDLPRIAQRPILSPIAASSALSYIYDYQGFFYQDGKKIFRISVRPILASEALVKGELLIEDSTWALRSADLTVNKAALTFCDSLSLNIEYLSPDSAVYLPASMQLTYRIKESPLKIFGSTRVRYEDYVLSPEFEPKFFNAEVKVYDPEAFDRDTTFWLNERKELLDASEMRFIDMADSLDLYYVSDEYYHKLDSAFNRLDWWTPLIGWGRRNRAAGTEIYIEGLVGQVNPLGVGGYRHMLPIHFKKDLKNDMTFETDLRPDYGFYNEDFKLKAGIGLTYVPKRFVRTYIEVGDFYERINGFSSFEQIFARSNFVNARTLSVFQRMEIVNGLFGELSVHYSDQRPITSVRISPLEEAIFSELAERLPFERYIKSEIRLDLQYRIRQKYFIRGNRKIIVGSDYPELFATYRKGIPGLFKSEVNFDYLELGVRHDTKLARFGQLSWSALGGSFLNKANLRILEYKFLRGSDQFFFSDPTRSMQLLGPTFSTPDPFVQANAIHHFEGTLLNKVPLINKLKLELAVGGGGLWVEESNFAQVELFAGLERAVRIKKQLFKFGIYGVTADNSVSTANYTVKFGINFFNTFTNSWEY